MDWTSQQVEESAVEQLAENAFYREFRYLFPFTTYLRSDGSFSPSYSHAEDFVSTFRQFNQETNLLAWIGIPLVNEARFDIQVTVDLSDASTREDIVAFTVKMVEETGFDGVHLDAETVRSGNDNYLLLLEEVNAAIGDRMLSVAGSYWLPRAVNKLPVLEEFKWDGVYYREVAKRVDQIVTMTYDSVMPCPTLYRLWLREQVGGIVRNLAASEVEVLFGISVSQENTFTHHPRAENMRSGLNGVCAGLSKYGEASSIAEGVAIYAAWEADAADWNIWESWVSALES